MNKLSTQIEDDPLLPLLTTACNQQAAPGWQVELSNSGLYSWIDIRHDHSSPPPQGWKLHISASITSAEAVLRRSLPVLLSEHARWKVIASIKALDSLNRGEGGLSQVGKFITVYPNDETQAICLAVALHKVTQGLRGPTILSDRPLHPGSLIHYRYGGFTTQHMQTSNGAIWPTISAPDGTLVPDQRLPFYQVPAWAIDPFIGAGVASHGEMQESLIGQRYVTMATLHGSPRGAVYLAMDVINPRMCVLKRARRDGVMTIYGQDARDRLRNEAAVLNDLAPDPRFPTFYDLIEQDGDLFLVMEDIAGTTLLEYVMDLIKQGRQLPQNQLVRWGRELAAALETIHAKGFVYCDLKSSNIIVGPDGHLRLIDFDAVYNSKTQIDRWSYGTRGYMPSERMVAQLPAPDDDLYSLGALLYFLATGAEPGLAPQPYALLDRPLEIMNPSITPELRHVIMRSLDPNPHKRFRSLEEIDTVLAVVPTDVPMMAVPFGTETLPSTAIDGTDRYRKFAHSLGTSLCRVACRLPDGHGLAWMSNQRFAGGVRTRDLSSGSGGIVLALAELVAELEDAEQRVTLVESARSLAVAPRFSGPPLPGFYIGEAGVGAALLRAGQVLHDQELIHNAEERGRWIATMPHVSPDLYNGTAGRLRFHLMLWDETARAEHLQAAIEAGDALLTSAKDTGDDELQWTIPPGYDGLSGSTYLGYAHGAAGIADALLDLFEVTGEERFLNAACGAGRWLERMAVPVYGDIGILTWPRVEGGSPGAAFWCHGAAGIGRFFLHLARLNRSSETSKIAASAARAVARGTRWASPIQCHGLAGNIEFLLDMAQATEDPAYLAEVWTLARLLEAFALERDGLLVWSSETPNIVTPDYMGGYAGVAVCLLRLSMPERLPHQLSRRGFQRG